MNVPVINQIIKKISQFEVLVYADKYNIWISSKELPHVHAIVTNPNKTTIPYVRPNPTANNPINTESHPSPQATKPMTTGVGGRTIRKEEPKTNNGESVDRAMLRELLKIDPHNKFYQSLHNWKGVFTHGQAAAIKRNWHREIGDKKTMNDKFDEKEKFTTDQEDNDPNWTPF